MFLFWCQGGSSKVLSPKAVSLPFGPELSALMAHTAHRPWEHVHCISGWLTVWPSTSNWTSLDSEGTALPRSRSCCGDEQLLWKHYVNHQMPFCVFIITDAPELSRTKNFFTKRWTSLEDEPSVLENNAKGAPLGPFFQIYPSSFGYSRLYNPHNVANLYITNPLFIGVLLSSK